MAIAMWKSAFRNTLAILGGSLAGRVRLHLHAEQIDEYASDFTVSLGRNVPLREAVKLWLNYQRMPADVVIVITEQADEEVEYDVQATPAELGWRRDSTLYLMIHPGADEDEYG